MKKFCIILFTLGILLVILQSAFKDPKALSINTLGRKLFFDPILSRTNKISCASCHKEEFAFSDTSAISLGVHKRKGLRNTPSAMNMSLQVAFFWDGRATTLEQQALIPIQNPIEMDLPLAIAIWRLQNNTYYKAAFQSVFQELPNKENLAKALSSFERTLETSTSPFDDWRLNDNEAAISESAKRGFGIFNNKGRCIQCHFGPDFNDVEFRSIGLYDGKALQDSGRACVTKKVNDLGRFKIGALRNTAITAPYMHNGMFKTLRQVIDYYNDPDKIVPRSINRDSLLNKPMYLTEQEKTDLESFLVSLTDKRFTAKLKKIKSLSQ